jgi:hypothetical protein
VKEIRNILLLRATHAATPLLWLADIEAKVASTIVGRVLAENCIPQLPKLVNDGNPFQPPRMLAFAGQEQEDHFVLFGQLDPSFPEGFLPTRDGRSPQTPARQHRHHRHGGGNRHERFGCVLENIACSRTAKRGLSITMVSGTLRAG